MVPVQDQPSILKWNDPIQRSLVRGRGRSIPLSAVIHLPLFTCFNEKLYSPIIMHL